jgi:hypothetical protein
VIDIAALVVAAVAGLLLASFLAALWWIEEGVHRPGSFPVTRDGHSIRPAHRLPGMSGG